MLILALILTLSQGGDPPALSVDPPLLQAPPVRPRQAPVLTYFAGMDQAKQTGKPLFVFVGVKAEPKAGYIVCEAPSLPGYPAKCVVLCRWIDGDLAWQATFGTDGKRIDPPLRGEGVQASPSPFERPFKGLRAWRTADDDLMAAGPWPASVEKPEGLIRYRRAEYTQTIGIVSDANSRNSRRFTNPVHRSNLAAKWQQSGGMEGISDFRSDIYKFLPSEPKTWKGLIGVVNSNGFTQHEEGWKRSYPDGSRFFDVLSKDGVVFEHRERSKSNGKWTSRVVYSDHTARPAGYTGLTQSCASCHDEAGSGGYAVGIVPGGDTVLSDPFEALEQP